LENIPYNDSIDLNMAPVAAGSVTWTEIVLNIP